jgi:hypothetical protein
MDTRYDLILTSHGIPILAASIFSYPTTSSFWSEAKVEPPLCNAGPTTAVFLCSEESYRTPPSAASSPCPVEPPPAARRTPPSLARAAPPLLRVRDCFIQVRSRVLMVQCILDLDVVILDTAKYKTTKP